MWRFDPLGTFVSRALLTSAGGVAVFDLGFAADECLDFAAVTDLERAGFTSARRFVGFGDAVFAGPFALAVFERVAFRTGAFFAALAFARALGTAGLAASFLLLAAVFPEVFRAVGREEARRSPFVMDSLMRRIR